MFDTVTIRCCVLLRFRVKYVQHTIRVDGGGTTPRGMSTTDTIKETFGAVVEAFAAVKTDNDKLARDVEHVNFYSVLGESAPNSQLPNLWNTLERIEKAINADPQLKAEFGEKGQKALAAAYTAIAKRLAPAEA